MTTVAISARGISKQYSRGPDGGWLGYDARPAYDRTTAGKLRKVGMDILACTPERLAESMAEIIRG